MGEKGSISWLKGMGMSLSFLINTLNYDLQELDGAHDRFPPEIP